MAIAATIYLGWLGPGGLAELGRQCAAKAAYAAARLTEVHGVELRHPEAPFFKEFSIRLPQPAERVRDALTSMGFLAGVPSRLENDVLIVAVTERTREEIDGLARAMKAVLDR